MARFLVANFVASEGEKMAKRICSVCGENKDVSGGKICEKSHFICYSCQKGRSKCPIDSTKLS